MSTMEAVAAMATGVEVEEADQESTLAVLDRQAHRWLGISGSEFLEAFAAGEYEGSDSAAIARLTSTARLLD